MYDFFLQIHLSNLNGMEPNNALYDSINSDDFVEIKKAVSLEKAPKEEVKEEKKRKSTVKVKTKQKAVASIFFRLSHKDNKTNKVLTNAE